MRTVHSTLDVPQSLIIRLALSDARIKFFVPNENAASWVTEVASPGAPIVFQVRDEDFDAAERVIREALDRIRETSEPDQDQKKQP